MAEVVEGEGPFRGRRRIRRGGGAEHGRIVGGEGDRNAVAEEAGKRVVAQLQCAELSWMSRALVRRLLVGQISSGIFREASVFMRAELRMAACRGRCVRLQDVDGVFDLFGAAGFSRVADQMQAPL